MKLSRRNFLGGSAVALASVAALGGRGGADRLKFHALYGIGVMILGVAAKEGQGRRCMWLRTAQGATTP